MCLGVEGKGIGKKGYGGWEKEGGGSGREVKGEGQGRVEEERRKREGS